MNSSFADFVSFRPYTYARTQQFLPSLWAAITLVNLRHISRTPFYKNNSGGLLCILFDLLILLVDWNRVYEVYIEFTLWKHLNIILIYLFSFQVQIQVSYGLWKVFIFVNLKAIISSQLKQLSRPFFQYNSQITVVEGCSHTEFTWTSLSITIQEKSSIAFTNITTVVILT